MIFIDLRSSRVGEENTSTGLCMSQVQGAWYVYILSCVLSNWFFVVGFFENLFNVWNLVFRAFYSTLSY